MGIDWRALDMSGYFETLEAFNEMNDPDGGKRGQPEPNGRLSKFLKAHAIQ